MQNLLKGVTDRKRISDGPVGIGSRLKGRIKTSTDREVSRDNTAIEQGNKLADELRKQHPESFEASGE